jgi:hypothetical protein
MFVKRTKKKYEGPEGLAHHPECVYLLLLGVANFREFFFGEAH